MRISWSWIRDLVQVTADVHEIAGRLTLAGLEVEAVTPLGGDLADVVVAEVRASRPHPRSGKLTIVTVTDGEGTTEVVCGAPNVPPPGHKVLWARPGARLPDGRVLAAREIQGISSPGMLCSQAELALGEDTSGIVVLSGEDAAAAPGTPVVDALALRDLVLDVNVTANRPDCLGHLGIAREIGALYGVPVVRPDASLEGFASEREAARLATVAIDDPIGCPRYTARVIEGLRSGPSPRWMRRRLEAVGVRPISNVVDVTNYVMFELGHPLHAFDYDRLAGGRIGVRRARQGERMRTLDEQERALVPDDLLICDERGPTALAGVMGGAGSEVVAGTTRVLLEAATFEPRAVRRTARRLQLLSEASYRFERGVDAHGVDAASARAARLLCEVAGGRVARGVVDAFPGRRPPLVVDLRPARADALLGVEVPPPEMVRLLRSIECSVDQGPGDLLRVTCPTFRPDLEREVDVIEEILRLHGFADVPATLPRVDQAPLPSGDPLAERVRDLCVAAGLDEAVTFAFTSPARLAALRLPPEHPASRPLPLNNPMRDEQAALRTSLVANLLAALARNLAFGVEDVRLFEVGSVFLWEPRQPVGARPGDAPLPDEPRFLGAVLAGERPGWLKPAGALDFYDAKGVVEHVLGGLHLAVEVAPARHELGFLHPGVAAAVLVDGVHVGVVGEVHPETRERLGIERRCYAIELNLERLPSLPTAMFRPIGRFPAVVRDVSFWVDESVPAGRVRGVVEADRPSLLQDVRVLEDYREAGRVPAGKKGMLWSMTYRSDDRTLTDEEVDRVHEALVARLLAALHAERR